VTRTNLRGGNQNPKPANAPILEKTDEMFETDEKEVWFVGCHSGAPFL